MQLTTGATGPRWKLDTQLQFLPGVGPRKAENLRRLGLGTVADLLRHFPRRYEDRRKLLQVAAAREGEAVVLAGRLGRLRERQSGARHLLTASLSDASGAIELVWFNQPYLLEWLQEGSFLHVYGSIRRRLGRMQMVSPEFEIDTGGDDIEGAPSLHLNRIVPIYQLTRGLHQRFFRRLVHRVLEARIVSEEGPFDFFHPGGPSAAAAYAAIHFPAAFADIEAARRRFVFEEHFRFATHLHERRAAFRSAGGTAFETTAELDRKIRSIFPFAFTREQDRVVEEVVRDLAGPAPMYRLLQGDVGTGKTAVALYALLVAVRNGYQGAILAPTEILAEQHHQTLSRFLAAHPVRIGLLTGSVKGAERRRLLEGIERGSIHLIAGTHALVQDSVTFARLGLVVIDEQHRFGVRERLRMRKKGVDPHLLVMTATPIPRSLCLTCYGDLDLSTIRERPPGRRPVKTQLVPDTKRPAAMELIRRELEKGRQAYFVYPLIEESETLALPAAVEAHRKLSAAFGSFSVGLAHGKLPAAEKERSIERFRSRQYQVLVTTVLVEVGIDVPNATVLFIEDATRFGLAQLHQLRGRVGRGEHPGYCLVGYAQASSESRERLKVFASTDDGFRLAEEDLRLRGPGDYLGLRQAGRPEGLGNPLEDLPEFLRVRRLASEFWDQDGNSTYRRRWRRFLDEGGSSLDGEFVGLD
jgi:ATP-dependent DNA helicase RecG